MSTSPRKRRASLSDRAAVVSNCEGAVAPISISIFLVSSISIFLVSFDQLLQVSSQLNRTLRLATPDLLLERI